MNRVAKGVMQRLHAHSSEELLDMWIACDETQQKHKVAIAHNIHYADTIGYCRLCACAEQYADNYKCKHCIWHSITKYSCYKGKGFSNSPVRNRELGYWKYLIQKAIEQREGKIGTELAPKFFLCGEFGNGKSRIFI